MNDQTDWQSCPPGTLSVLSHRAQRRHLLGLAVKTAGAVGGVSLCAAFGWWTWLQSLKREGQNLGLTCGDVRKLWPDYARGKLDEHRSEQLRRHVLQCENCADLRESLRVA